MAQRRQAGRLIIVSGLPGSGKTTLARRLEQEHDGLRFCPDEWMAELGIDLFDADARERIERLQWTVAERVLEIGGTAIVEWGTWSRAERAALHRRARELGAAVELQFLDVPVDVLWSRIENRNLERRLGRRALTRGDIQAWANRIERPDDEELALFDPPTVER